MYTTYSCGFCHKAFRETYLCQSHEECCPRDERNKHCQTCKWTWPGAKCLHPDGDYLRIWDDGKVYKGQYNTADIKLRHGVQLVAHEYSRMNCPGWERMENK